MISITMNMNKIIWYLKLARLDRPVGIFLLLWPTLWALLFASNGNLKILNVLVFLAGVVLTRSAGCVINDIFDRNIDANVQRTSLRPLAQNKISLMGAVIFFVILGILSLCLLLILESYAIKLVFLCSALLMIYPLTKRVFVFPQFFLALAFSSSILVVYAHTQQSLPLQAWILFFANFFWVISFDTIYAMADYQDDLKIDIYSAPKFFKNYTIPIILLCYALFFLFLSFLINKQETLFFNLFFGLYVMLVVKNSLNNENIGSDGYIKLFKLNNYLGMIITILLIYEHL
jgi:4-hydroxybenzoate polyprenyltransferase